MQTIRFPTKIHSLHTVIISRIIYAFVSGAFEREGYKEEIHGLVILKSGGRSPIGLPKGQDLGMGALLVANTLREICGSGTLGADPTTLLA